MDVVGPIADAEGAVVVLGVNLDDLGDHRPGQRAADGAGRPVPARRGRLHQGHAARGVTRARVCAPGTSRPQRVSRAGSPTAPRCRWGLLSQIDRAEAGLRRLGFVELRVRHYGDTARLEVPIARIADVVERREDVVATVKRCGYRYVTLDLEGLRSGNLNDGHVSSGLR